MPDLAQAFRDAPYELKRQTLEAFDVQIAYDKTARRIEISATISEAVAQALENAEDLPEEAFVATRDMAGGPDSSVGATLGSWSGIRWRRRAPGAVGSFVTLADWPNGADGAGAHVALDALAVTGLEIA